MELVDGVLRSGSDVDDRLNRSWLGHSDSCSSPDYGVADGIHSCQRNWTFDLCPFGLGGGRSPAMGSPFRGRANVKPRSGASRYLSC